MASLLVSPGPLPAFSPLLRHRRSVHHLAGASSLQNDVVEKILAMESGVGVESEPGSSNPFPPIKTAKRVVLVRHGQSTWNAEGRIQGSSDFSVLTPKGESRRRPLAKCSSLITLMLVSPGAPNSFFYFFL